MAIYLIFDLVSSLACLPGLISKQDDELNMVNSNFQQPSSFASAKKGIVNVIVSIHKEAPRSKMYDAVLGSSRLFGLRVRQSSRRKIMTYLLTTILRISSGTFLLALQIAWAEE